MRKGSRGANRVPAALLLLICSAQAFAGSNEQQKPPKTEIKPQPVRVSEVRPIEVPEYSFNGADQCDSDGNMYSHLTEPALGVGHGTEVLRLRHDGKDALLFRLPSEYGNGAKYQISDATTTPDGDVFFLIYQRDNRSSELIVPFDRLGEAKSPISIEHPEGVFGVRVGAFTNGGGFFIAGFYDEDSPTSLRGRTYAAVYDRNGKLIRELKGVSSRPGTGAMQFGYRNIIPTSAADGNLYLLNQKEVVILSPSGQTQRAIPFRLPEDGAVAKQLFVSGPNLLVYFSTYSGRKISADPSARELQVMVSSTLLTMDTSKAKPVRQYYDVPMEIARIPLSCYSFSEGATFKGRYPSIDSAKNFSLVTVVLP